MATERSDVVEQAVQDAVKKERSEIEELLQENIRECFCREDSTPCERCHETARILGQIRARSEATSPT